MTSPLKLTNYPPDDLIPSIERALAHCTDQEIYHLFMKYMPAHICQRIDNELAKDEKHAIKSSPGPGLGVFPVLRVEFPGGGHLELHPREL